jgi:hypothetical protein
VRNLGRALARRLRWWRLTPDERARDTVTISTLGNHRFGNQLFQFLFLRTYADAHGLRHETSPWMGERLFGHLPVPITRALPEFREKFVHGVDDTLVPHAPDVIRNVDFRGYFQYHTSWYAPHREKIVRLFQPVGPYRERAEEGLARLRARGRTVVALHLRRGDFGYEYFFIAPAAWYRAWLATFWHSLEEPVLYLASDEPDQVVDAFADYAPVLGRDLGVAVPDFDFYLDFHLLAHADRLAISNSVFSFAAAMLNERATHFVRPVLQEQRLVPFDPWDSKPLLQDARVEDHPEVEGIASVRSASMRARNFAKARESRRRSP